MILWEDSGHGGRDPGSGAAGVREKDLTLDIGNRMTRIARENGIRVKRTRNGDITVDPNPRTRAIKNSGADLCISNHINAGGGEGVEVLISKYNDGKLANSILKELQALGLKNRGTKKRLLKSGQDYYFMHRQTGNVTTLIVEYGFIDNKKDRDFISKAENREKMAAAVVKAICNHYGLPFKGSSPTKEEGDLVTKTLQRGAVDPQVKVLQRKLKALGHYNGSIDGSYGPGTFEAVKAFQRANGLQVDGSCGPATRKVLNAKKDKLYRVQVGAFKEKSNALKLSEELKKKGYSNFIVEK